MPFEDAPGEKGYVTKLIEAVADKMGKSKQLQEFVNSYGGKALGWITDKVGEGLEEVVTGLLDPAIDWVTYDPDAKIDSLAEEFVGGFMLAMLMTGGEALIDNVNTTRTGKDYNLDKDTVQALLAEAKSVPQLQADPAETRRIYEALGLEAPATPETKNAGLAWQRPTGYNERTNLLLDTFLNADGSLEGGKDNGDFQGEARDTQASDAGAQAAPGDRSGVQEEVRRVSSDDNQIRDADGEGHGRLTVAEETQQVLQEHGITTHIISSEKWTHKQPAFTRNSEVYLRSDIPEEYRGMVAAHEITHVMRQVGYQQYLDFLKRTPSMCDTSSSSFRSLLQTIAENRKIDPFTSDLVKLSRLYDELNATVYGHIASGKVDGAMDAGLHSAFYDFDAYAAELRSIHEQFKRSRSPGNTQLNTGSAEGTESNPFGAVHSGQSGYSQLLDAYRNNPFPTAVDEYALLASAFPEENEDYFSVLGMETPESQEKAGRDPKQKKDVIGGRI